MWIVENKNKLLFLLFVYWMVCNYLVLHAPIQFFSVKDVKPLTQAFSQVVADSEQVALDTLGEFSSELTPLPDDWYHRNIQEQNVWYRANFDVQSEKNQIWAFYLPSVTHNAAVYINKVWIGQGGSFSEPVARRHNDPLYFEFSSALLGEENTVDIRVKASYPTQGLVDQFYIAPAEKLRSAYEWKRFFRVDFIRWITMAMYFMGLIVLCFWLARPQDKIYGLFALQLFIWATHNLNLFIIEIPTSAHFWEAMTMSTLGWTVVAMIFFNHRYVGERSLLVEKIVLVFGICGLGIFFLPDIGDILTIGYGVWDSFLIIFGSYAIIHLLRVFWKRKELDVYLMLLVGIPILAFGFHDILTVNNLRDRREGLTIQYSVIPAIILFSFFLVRRFVQSINVAEEMSASLEQRVIEKQEALEGQYRQLKSMEQEQLLSQERERIMRDMHDGIGGQLVSVITSLQEHKGTVFRNIQDKVQASLTDLRFVIDSLDPMLNDLPTLLGMMRSRLQDQLCSAGIELEWNIHELPELEDLSPQRSLHIMRIVQECVTNAIKHAQTDKIRLTTSHRSDSGNWIEIDVQDFGLGFGQKEREIRQSLRDADQVKTYKAHRSGSGRGLRNIQYRARQVGAEFELFENESQNGLCARLKIPYTKSAVSS